MKQKLVSVVIPSFNSVSMIEDCLKSVTAQTYKNIEILIIDSFSTDRTTTIAKKYGTVYSFGRDPQQKNIFAVPYQRNYGAEKAKGDYIYYIDSDMRLTPKIIETCVSHIEKEGADAVIVPEDSYGEGFWSDCRALEKSCYNASSHSYTDAARFIKASVWKKLGGLDATLGGGDDWDFQIRLDANGFKTIKSPLSIRHYEGRLTLGKQLKKKYIYGKNVLDYFKKHSDKKVYVLKQYSLIRPDFIKNFDKLLRDPVHALGMIFMKTLEYTAAFFGMIVSLINHETVIIRQTK